MIYGYARVSTDGQTLDAQLEALKAEGCTDKTIFREKVSGARRDRAQLSRLLDQLAADDVLVVTRLDRLARSTLDMLHTLKRVTEKGASFKSLGDPWADTTTPHGRLMVTFIAGVAEFERELIVARTSEGRERARARGVHLGRHPTLTDNQQQEAQADFAAGRATKMDLARRYNVDRTTISRTLTRMQKNAPPPTKHSDAAAAVMSTLALLRPQDSRITEQAKAFLDSAE